MTIHLEYLEDAKNHLALSAVHIKENMTGAERFQAIMFSAIGFEKLLKHIVSNVNPALVLKSQDFDSVVFSCHLDLVTASEKKSELEKKASLDVITFRASIQRAALFCDGVKNNSQFLHALADFRDLAVHRYTGEIDVERSRTLLCRDLYDVIRDIAACCKLTTEDFFQGQNSRLEELAREIAFQDNFNAQMSNLLESHRAIWAKRSSNPQTIANADKITGAYLKKRSDTSACKCPACGNIAVATLEPDFDYDYDPVDGSASAYVTGVYVTDVHCLYCALKLDQYDQLEYVDADSLMTSD